MPRRNDNTDYANFNPTLSIIGTHNEATRSWNFIAFVLDKAHDQVLVPAKDAKERRPGN